MRDAGPLWPDGRRYGACTCGGRASMSGIGPSWPNPHCRRDCTCDASASISGDRPCGQTVGVLDNRPARLVLPSRTHWGVTEIFAWLADHRVCSHNGAVSWNVTGERICSKGNVVETGRGNELGLGAADGRFSSPGSTGD